MTEPGSLPDLERLNAAYRAAKARLDEIGFTCEGSLIERYTSCKNPNCRCQNPEQRHGPYWQISYKQDGKTVSKILPADDAALYQEWIANAERSNESSTRCATSPATPPSVPSRAAAGPSTRPNGRAAPPAERTLKPGLSTQPDDNPGLSPPHTHPKPAKNR